VYLFFVTPSLDCYDRYKQISLSLEEPLDSLIQYAENGLGNSWSEYCILEMATNRVPYIVNTIHKQAPLRKNIQLNKRKKQCSNKPTPQSDPSLPTQLSPTHHPQPNWSNLLNVLTSPSMSSNAETQLSEDSAEPASTEQEMLSF